MRSIHLCNKNWNIPSPLIFVSTSRSRCASTSCHHNRATQHLDIIVPCHLCHTTQHNSELLKQSWFIPSVLMTLLLPHCLLQTQMQTSAQNKLLQLLANRPVMMLLCHASMCSDRALKIRASSKRQQLLNIALVPMTRGRLSRSPGLRLLCSLILAYHRDVRKRIQAQATQLPQTLSLPFLLRREGQGSEEGREGDESNQQTK
jgi:hypothetical protein